MSNLENYMSEVLEASIDSDASLDNEISDAIELEDEIIEDEYYDVDEEEIEDDDEIVEESSLSRFKDDLMAETHNAVQNQIEEDNIDFDDDDDF